MLSSLDAVQQGARSTLSVHPAWRLQSAGEGMGLEPFNWGRFSPLSMLPLNPWVFTAPLRSLRSCKHLGSENSEGEQTYLSCWDCT